MSQSALSSYEDKASMTPSSTAASDASSRNDSGVLSNNLASNAFSKATGEQEELDLPKYVTDWVLSRATTTPGERQMVNSLVECPRTTCQHYPQFDSHICCSPVSSDVSSRPWHDGNSKRAGTNESVARSLFHNTVTQDSCGNAIEPLGTLHKTWLETPFEKEFDLSATLLLVPEQYIELS